MTRKVFYFVRHGESLLNAASIRQGSEGSLSDKGQAQAADTGKRLAHHKLDVILVSPYVRTKETAAIINEQFPTPKKVEYLDLLHERRNPSEIIGKSMTDPEVKRIVDTIDKSFHDDAYRYSDEENFDDLKNRARTLLEYLASRREKNILVVTHGIFLRMVVAYIEFGEQLNSATYNTLSFFNASNNAAITICQYKRGIFGPSKDKRWEILAWDDYTRDTKKTGGI
ncbi:MAG: histidine phosphatase family protein [Patescibacteria group bacterium]